MTSRVIVAGGGPAGLAAAGGLARGGLHVTVLEAGTYPRTRLCGEFLSPDAEAALATLGVADLADRLGAPTISRVRITAAIRGRTAADLVARLPRAGRGVSRLDLDACLAAAARAVGVELRERVRVTSVVGGEDEISVVSSHGTVAADAVVVATGRLARPAGLGDGVRRARRWVGAKVHVRRLELPSVTELHFVRGAYVGLNEVSCGGERRVNVCALARQSFWDAAGTSVEELMEAIAARSPAFAARWRGAAPIGASSATAAGFTFEERGAKAPQGPRPPLVCGDAAVLIAPLAGDGQAMALTAGVRAAEALAASFRDAGALSSDAVRLAAGRYARRFRRDMAARLRAGRLLQRALLHPTSAAALLRGASAARAIPDWLYRATRGPITDRSGACGARSS